MHINCVAHVVDFLRTNMSTNATSAYSSQVRDIKRVFWEVRIDEVNTEKTWNAKELPNCDLSMLFEVILGWMVIVSQLGN